MFSVYSKCTGDGLKSSGVHMTNMKVVLTAIAFLLAALLVTQVTRPVAVAAQTEPANLYIEPGTSPIRNLNGGITGDGKVVINMTTGDVWGYPTHGAGAPYPIDALAADGRPTVVKPVFLGEFDFAALRRVH
jgi:hypothetical protein